jgi:hypothetical protein
MEEELEKNRRQKTVTHLKGLRMNKEYFEGKEY